MRKLSLKEVRGFRATQPRKQQRKDCPHPWASLCPWSNALSELQSPCVKLRDTSFNSVQMDLKIQWWGCNYPPENPCGGAALGAQGMPLTPLDRDQGTVSSTCPSSGLKSMSVPYTVAQPGAQHLYHPWVMWWNFKFPAPLFGDVTITSRNPRYILISSSRVITCILISSGHVVWYWLPCLSILQIWSYLLMNSFETLYVGFLL